MRLASFPTTSPWFKRSLLTGYTEDELRAMEPRTAVLAGVTDKHNAFHTARLTIDGRTYQATARRAPDALNAALVMSQMDLPEIVGINRGDAA